MVACRTGAGYTRRLVVNEMGVVAGQLAQAGVIAIVRAASAEGLVEAAGALYAGGLRAMEVTLNTPGALQAIVAVRAAWPEMVCGAGTILNAGDAVAAIGAGAQFIVTPTLQIETIAVCHARGAPVVMGCASPTEALAAHRAGAAFIKVFPAGRFGLSHIAAVLEELPQLRLVPTGGVTPENLHEFFAAGCPAVGVGSNLVSKGLLAARDWAGLTAAARRFAEAVAAARSAQAARRS